MPDTAGHNKTLQDIAGHMPLLTISDAAKAAGLSRSQFYAGYIKTGKVTVDRTDSKKPKIDTAEIIRVFGAIQPDKTQPDTAGHNKTLGNTMACKDDLTRTVSELTAKLAELENGNELLKKELRMTSDHLDDVKKDRDHWRNAAENHQKLLTAGQGERDQKDEELRSMIAELRTQVDVLSKKRGGFWRWLRPDKTTVQTLQDTR